MSAFQQLIPQGFDLDVIRGRVLPEVRELVEDRAGDLLELTRRYGTHLGRMVGCGQFGCVWEILDGEQDTPYVLKVTDDITEGPSTQAILNTGLDKTSDGLARIEGVWAFYPDEQTSYAIVRENIRPWERLFLPGGADVYLSRHDPELAERWTHWWGLSDYTISSLNAYSQRTMRWLAAKADAIAPKPRRETVEGMEEERELAIEALVRNPLTRPIGEVILQLAPMNIYPLDLHEGNLGSRFISWPGAQQAPAPLFAGASVTLSREWTETAPAQYPMLMFDLGHFSVPRGKLDPLWGQLRENPALAELRAAIPAL